MSHFWKRINRPWLPGASFPGVPVNAILETDDDKPPSSDYGNWEYCGPGRGKDENTQEQH